MKGGRKANSRGLLFQMMPLLPAREGDRRARCPSALRQTGGRAGGKFSLSGEILPDVRTKTIFKSIEYINETFEYIFNAFEYMFNTFE